MKQFTPKPDEYGFMPPAIVSAAGYEHYDDMVQAEPIMAVIDLICSNMGVKKRTALMVQLVVELECRLGPATKGGK